MAEKEKDPKSSPLERYMTILEAVVSAPDGMTGGELEKLLGFPKTTVNRLLYSLSASDLVVAGQRRGSYVFGPRLARLLESDTSWLERASHEPLKRLAEETGETCFIARLYGVTVRSVVMESPDSSVGVYVIPGHDLPPHAAATGKLLAAYQEEGVRNAILEAELEKLTSRTMLDRDRLETEFAQIREQGYAVENGEHVRGLYTVAAPVMSASGKPPIYSIGITGPAERMGEAMLPTLLEKIKRTGAELSTTFSRRIRGET